MQAAHAARLGKHASPMAQMVMESQGVGPAAHDPRSLSPVAARAAAAAGGWKGLGKARGSGGDDESEVGEGPLARAPDADSDDDDLSSLASEDLEHMAYDELQAQRQPLTSNPEPRTPNREPLTPNP